MCEEPRDRAEALTQLETALRDISGLASLLQRAGMQPDD